MVDREREGDELKEVFSVLGSTGNVRSCRFFLLALNVLLRFTKYRLIIYPDAIVRLHYFSYLPCASPYPGPDFQKGNHCKHIVRVTIILSYR